MQTPEKYTRTTALEYFRENSNLLMELKNIMPGNITYELRQKNGQTFILCDMMRNGWQLYLPTPGIEIEANIKAFNEL